MKVRIVEKVDFEGICAPKPIYVVQKRILGFWFPMKSFSALEGALHYVATLQSKLKFEKVIKDYTGAEKIKYGWLNNVKDTRHNFTTRAPTVDHQSISRMYDSISETEESMRDFIFSNRSQLIIDGEDTPSLDVLRKKSPGITNHETKIIFYVNISGEKNNGIETIYHTKWPGGKVIRNNIINFGENLQYNATKKIFEKRRYFYGTNPIDEEINDELEAIENICIKKKNIIL